MCRFLNLFSLCVFDCTTNHCGSKLKNWFLASIHFGWSNPGEFNRRPSDLQLNSEKIWAIFIRVLKSNPTKTVLDLQALQLEQRESPPHNLLANVGPLSAYTRVHSRTLLFGLLFGALCSSSLQTTCTTKAAAL